MLIIVLNLWGDKSVPQVDRTQEMRSTVKRRSSIKVMLSWKLMVLSAVLMPILIIILKIFFDVVPFYPEIGAFIIAAGAISMVTSFSFVVKYKAVNEKIAATWNESKKVKKKDLRELTSKMYLVAAMAEIPSLAGLLYFLATRDVIASFILCIPAVAVAVICRPMLPLPVLEKLK